METLSFGQKMYIGNVIWINRVRLFDGKWARIPHGAVQSRSLGIGQLIGSIRIRLETYLAYWKHHSRLETHILETFNETSFAESHVKNTIMASHIRSFRGKYTICYTRSKFSISEECSQSNFIVSDLHFSFPIS